MTLVNYDLLTDRPSDMKPLFIPLKTEYYKAFADGNKEHEYRKYGPRWNEKTCIVGRPVILSKGYGKKNRMIGAITSFERKRGEDFTGFGRSVIRIVYGTLDVELAVIGISLLKPVKYE